MYVMIELKNINLIFYYVDNIKFKDIDYDKSCFWIRRCYFLWSRILVDNG